jgi:DNA processing protein
MLRYWLWLSTRKGLGVKGQRAVMTHFGSPETAYLADEAGYAAIEELNSKERAALMDKDMTEAEQILNDCYEKNISLLTWQDALYPERLKNIDNPPMLLYYKGTMPMLDTIPTIAVVGSRKASAYGLSNAYRLGYQMGKCGMIVVSGLAMGIDSRAMLGCLSAGQSVIGVLGCGLDVIYPRSSASLYHETQMRGCLISEYPPGTPPRGQNFPVRNRILSGLSLGVVVVEAGSRSGSLITAEAALEQGRDVFAVPSNVGVLSSVGSNRLLKEGAIYAESGWDVAREYAAQFPGQLHEYHGSNSDSLQKTAERAAESEGLLIAQEVRRPEVKREAARKKPVDKSENKVYIDLQDIKDELSGDETTIITLLSEGEKLADELIDQAQISAARILASLTLLEVKGYVVRLSGRRYRLAYRQEILSEQRTDTEE